MQDIDIPPPRPLSPAARQVWDRCIARIHREGRHRSIDQELLAVFADTMVVYLQAMAEIDAHGVLVQGRSERELVKNPASTILNQARGHLLLLAPRIPLVAPAAGDAFIDDVDRLLDEMKNR